MDSEGEVTNGEDTSYQSFPSRDARGRDHGPESNRSSDESTGTLQSKRGDLPDHPESMGNDWTVTSQNDGFPVRDQDHQYSVITHSVTRVSPLPPADDLERYETLYPGAAKLVFESYRDQSNAVIENQRTVTNAWAYGLRVAVTGFTLVPFSYMLVIYLLGGKVESAGMTLFGLAAVITAGATFVGLKSPKKTSQSEAGPDDEH